MFVSMRAYLERESYIIWSEEFHLVVERKGHNALWLVRLKKILFDIYYVAIYSFLLIGFMNRYHCEKYFLSNHYEKQKTVNGYFNIKKIA